LRYSKLSLRSADVEDGTAERDAIHEKTFDHFAERELSRPNDDQPIRPKEVEERFREKPASR